MQALRFALILLLVLTGGCTTMSIPVTPLPPGINLQEELQKLEYRLSEAEENDVDYLSAVSYNKAEQALAEAQELAARESPGESPRESKDDLAEKLAEGQAFLTHAEKRAEVARTLLKDARDARADAVSVNAGKYFPSTLEKVDVKLLAMAQLIEEGDSSVSEKENAGVIEVYRKLENSAARMSYLRDPQKNLREALNMGAAQFAPKTLQQSKATLVSLDRQIQLNAADSERVLPLSERAARETELLLRVTQQSKLIQAPNPEETALRGEIEKTLQSHFTAEEASVVPDGERFGIHLKKLFEPNKSTINSEGELVLQKVKQVLTEFEDKITVFIEVSLDSSGRLNFERTEAVKAHLADGTTPQVGIFVAASAKELSRSSGSAASDLSASIPPPSEEFHLKRRT